MAEVFNMELREGGDVEEELSDEEYPMPEGHNQVLEGRKLAAYFTTNKAT